MKKLFKKIWQIMLDIGEARGKQALKNRRYY